MKEEVIAVRMRYLKAMWKAKGSAGEFFLIPDRTGKRLSRHFFKKNELDIVSGQVHPAESENRVEIDVRRLSHKL